MCKSLSFGKVARLDLNSPSNRASTETFGCFSRSAVLLLKVCACFHINHVKIHQWISERFLSSPDTRKKTAWSARAKLKSQAPGPCHDALKRGHLLFGNRSPMCPLKVYSFSLPILHWEKPWMFSSSSVKKGDTSSE